MNHLTLPPLIAITSDRPESGKSTLARMLRIHGYHRAPLAADLKAWLAQFLILHGYSLREARHFLNDAKNEPLTRIPDAPTARRLLVTLGTGWGRVTIHPEVWLKPWSARVHRALSAGKRIVVDDLRLPNEVIAVQQLGGVAIRVNRPDAPALDLEAAPVENILDRLSLPEVLNDSSIEALLDRTVELLQQPPCQPVRHGLH